MKKAFILIILFLSIPIISDAQVYNAGNSTLPKAQQEADKNTVQKPAPTQNQVTNTQGGRYEYKPLVPGFPQPEASGTKDFAGYINSVIKTIIGLTGILAVLMIVIGGIQYVSTDSWSGKDQGKKRIQAALGGLLLALSSFLILNTIDPSLTYLNFATRLEPVKVDQVVGGFAGGGVGSSTEIQGTGGSIGTSQGGTLTLENAFPNEAWNKIVYDAVIAEGILNMNINDVARFFPNGVTAEAWTQFIAKIANKESSFNPGTVFYEKSMGKNSVGLLQLSADDMEVKALGYTETDLMDPQKNLTVGVRIMARQLRQDGCIYCKGANGRWAGITEYWSTLR